MHSNNQLLGVLDKFYKSVKQGTLHSFLPLLPLFKLGSKPMNLNMHYQLAPLYNTKLAPQTLMMLARQLGKSYGIASSLLLRCQTIPFFHTLVVQPRIQQIQRFNNTVLKPLLQTSPATSMFINKTELVKMQLKQFKLGSLLYMGAAFTSADALRGASGICTTAVDQAQDVEYDYLPVIHETMSATLYYGFTLFTGTPKTTDTTLGKLWEQTSKAEWIIKCQHCGKDNIPNPQQDLQKMIGQTGLICAKCGKSVHPRTGRYIHAIPSRIKSFPGYHLAQPAHPLHLSIPQKWDQLMVKIRDYPKVRLYNEVYGWPYDQSTSPMILKNLLDARHNIKCESMQDVQAVARNYRCIAIGVDWGGGGAVSDSYTAMAVVGLRVDSNVIDVLYGKRWDKYCGPKAQVDQVISWVSHVHPDLFTHDNTGAGFLRLQMLKQAGLLDLGATIIPFTYRGPGSGDVIKFIRAQRQPDLYYYTLDKSRSMAITLQAIKNNRIRLMPFQPQDQYAVQMDFLALRQDPRRAAGSQTVLIIIKKPGVPDDWAHAVNFAASAVWDKFGAFPKLGVKYDSSILQRDQLGNLVPQSMGPRGDFDRFTQALKQHADIVMPNIYIGD